MQSKNLSMFHWKITLIPFCISIVNAHFSAEWNIYHEGSCRLLNFILLLYLFSLNFKTKYINKFCIILFRILQHSDTTKCTLSKKYCMNPITSAPKFDDHSHDDIYMIALDYNIFLILLTDLTYSFVKFISSLYLAILKFGLTYCKPLKEQSK